MRVTTKIKLAMEQEKTVDEIVELLFAALNVLDRKVIAQCQQSHRHAG